MTKPIGDAQSTAEAWEIGATLINSQGATRVVFQDENGVYHTVSANTLQAILNGQYDAVVLSGEIIDPQPSV